MENRLKIMRTVKGYTQKQVAEKLGITQNAYSYWECNKVNISSEDMKKLAALFGVNIDFLSGRRYRITRKPQTWESDYYSDYVRAKPAEKTYMEYLYGQIVYIDDVTSNEVIANNPIEVITPITDQEQQLLRMFRETTEEGKMRIITAVVTICDQMEKKRMRQAIRVLLDAHVGKVFSVELTTSYFSYRKKYIN